MSELTKIAITALAAAFARELVAFIIRQSGIVATTLKALAIKILKRHWRIFPIFVDLVVIIIGIKFLYYSYSDTTSATRQFVIFTVLICIFIWSAFNDFQGHLLKYVQQFYKPKI